MGCYFSHNGTSTIDSVVAALKERPRGAKLLAAGDFNVNLSEPEDHQRGEDTTAAMVTEILGICRCTSSGSGAHGAGTGGHGV